MHSIFRTFRLALSRSKSSSTRYATMSLDKKGMCSTFNSLSKVRQSSRAFSAISWASSDSKKFQNFQQNHKQQCRQFWGVEVAFNKVDEERVRLAGPDRAAAEWVLRNGGSIKWTTSSKPLLDYNLLPSTSFDSYKLEEIDLSATDVIALGFEHLKDLHHLRKIKLHGVRTVSDEALFHLMHVKDTLEVLEISKCPMITEKGLKQLHDLKNLKLLVLYDLIETRSFDQTVENLRKSMPWVSIETTDPFTEKEEHDDG